MKVPEPFEPLKKDETITIEVVVESNPKPTIIWTLNGKELTVKDGVKIFKDVANNTYSLTIIKLNSSAHAGNYIIKATNTIGTTTHEIKLDILGYLIMIF